MTFEGHIIFKKFYLINGASFDQGLSPGVIFTMINPFLIIFIII